MLQGVREQAKVVVVGGGGVIVCGKGVRVNKGKANVMPRAASFALPIAFFVEHTKFIPNDHESHITHIVLPPLSLLTDN